MSSDKVEMQEQLNKLINLQKIDSEKIKLKREIEKLPEVLNDIVKDLDKSLKLLDIVKSKTDSEAKKKKNIEIEIQKENDNIEKKKSRVSDLKTNKEYESHMHEIEVAKMHVSSLEDSLLGLLESFDKINEDHKKMKRLCSQKQTDLDKRKSEITDRVKVLESRIADMTEEYSKLEKKIETKLIDNYNKTKKRNKGLGLVEVKKGICYGCHLSLTPQFFAELKKKNKIHKCPHCFRLLYWNDEQPAGL